MKKYKIQVKIRNVRRHFFKESLDLLFPYSAQPCMVAESLIITKKKDYSCTRASNLRPLAIEPNALRCLT